MNKEFRERLEEFLNSECDDYGLQYSYEYDEENESCDVEITSDYNSNSKCLVFNYDEKKDDLTLELVEGSFYKVREFDYTVKYFWLLVAPAMFPVS